MSIEPADIHLALDVAVGWLIGRVAWIAAQELFVKPVLFRVYEGANRWLGGRLPSIR